MTRTRKDGSQYLKKLRRLTQQFAPAVSEQQLMIIEAKLTDITRKLDRLVCELSTEDTDRYTEADRHPPRRDALGNLRLGYCREHETLHRYPRQILVARVKAVSDDAVASIQSLNPGQTLPHDLWDMVINRFNSALTQLLDRHTHDMVSSRQAHSHLQRVALMRYYEALPFESKLDFYRCGRKNTHVSEAIAYQALNELPPSTPGLDLYVVYACRYCSHYHLGHSSKQNNYSAASMEDMESYADYTWYNNFKKAKKYASAQGLDLDVIVTQADVEDVPRWREAEPIFRG